MRCDPFIPCSGAGTPPAGRRDGARSIPRRRWGFTVVELMLSVAIMTVIVIGLYTVFDQTQKALRSSMTQIDVLEGVRATTDLLVRDFEGAAPVDFNNTNLTSFAASTAVFAKSAEIRGLDPAGDPVMRTVLQDVFFVTRQNDMWTAVGYWVGTITTNSGFPSPPGAAGRLFRFSYSAPAHLFSVTNLYTRFANAAQREASSQGILDGVVHFRVRAYDVDGKALVHTLQTNTPMDLRPWFIDPLRNTEPWTETAYWFKSTTVPRFPSALELEVGILEPQVAIRVNSIPVESEALKFLSRQADKIHLFRQRIPLRNAPPY